MKKQYLLLLTICTIVTIDASSFSRSFSQAQGQFKNWFTNLFSRRTAFATGAVTGAAMGGLTTYQITKPVVNPYQQEFIDSQLILASRANNINAMENALKAGANINAQDKFGRTPLMEASTDATRLLLDRGANVSAKDISGKTAKEIAQEKGDAQKVSLMRYYTLNRSLDAIGQWFRGLRSGGQEQKS
jgi:hypothetical protein